jgi:RsiW-degrading membrane proteinase PrsW (M82 family)
MQIYLAATGAIPALAAMYYVDRLDAKRPEPRSSLRRVAIGGAIMALPCMGAEFVIGNNVTMPTLLAGLAFRAFVIAGCVEELGKLLAVRVFIWDKPELDERMDGIVYGTRAGLGFALVENVWYLFRFAPDLETFAYLFAVRGLLAVPGHAIWTGYMGYFAARRRFDRKGPGFLGGWLIAVLMHGAYDFALFTLPVALAVPPALLIIVGGGLLLRRLARRAIQLDDAAAAQLAPAVTPAVRY